MSCLARFVYIYSSADLVFDYGISEVICKIAGGGHVPFVLRIIGSVGAFGK